MKIVKPTAAPAQLEPNTMMLVPDPDSSTNMIVKVTDKDGTTVRSTPSIDQIRNLASAGPAGNTVTMLFSPFQEGDAIVFPLSDKYLVRYTRTNTDEAANNDGYTFRGTITVKQGNMRFPYIRRASFRYSNAIELKYYGIMGLQTTQAFVFEEELNCSTTEKTELFVYDSDTEIAWIVYVFALNGPYIKVIINEYANTQAPTSVTDYPPEPTLWFPDVPTGPTAPTGPTGPTNPT